MSTHESLNQLAQTLEQKTLDLIQAGDWPALEAMIAAECQFVTNGGIFNKAEAMALMQAMHLEAATLRHVTATECGDTLIVSFELACTELIGGKRQSKDYSPRLSVWKKRAAGYQCIAYGDFNRE